VNRSWIATVILSKMGKKGTTECPLGGYCDAPSGRHHSMLIWGPSSLEVREELVRAGYYVARVEASEVWDD
jgi:hypothetical protein